MANLKRYGSDSYPPSRTGLHEPGMVPHLFASFLPNCIFRCRVSKDPYGSDYVARVTRELGDAVAMVVAQVGGGNQWAAQNELHAVVIDIPSVRA